MFEHITDPLIEESEIILAYPASLNIKNSNII